jgi:hypothetical protein
MNGAVPAKSMDKADAAFKHFNASGFPKGAKPPSYVDPADGPAAVRSVQKRIMREQLSRLKAMDAPDVGMTLALPASEVAKLLPSLNSKAATIELSDVVNVIAQHMRGTEFYANGNPVLNRLALRSRARELIAVINQDAAAAQPRPKAAPKPQGSKTPEARRSARAAAPPRRTARAAASPRRKATTVRRQRGVGK